MRPSDIHVVTSFFTHQAEVLQVLCLLRDVEPPPTGFVLNCLSILPIDPRAIVPRAIVPIVPRAIVPRRVRHGCTIDGRFWANVKLGTHDHQPLIILLI